MYKAGLLALIGLCLSGALPAWAQVSSIQSPLNEPLRPHGQSVIPLFDGWFANSDGSYTLCFGYFNMNTEQVIEVPLGERNFIEPAIYDGLQPTHFDPVPTAKLTRPYRHHWCVFSVIVPEDFGNSEVVWTLETQGERLSVPGWLLPSYVLDEETTSGRGAVAPYLSLNDDPPNFRGRRGLFEGPRQTRVGAPLQLTARVSHPQDGTWLSWTKHQGPGNVAFSESEIRVSAANAVAISTATFDQPGRYVLRVQAINDTEQPSNPTYGFEFYCCWTNGYVQVDVLDLE